MPGDSHPFRVRKTGIASDLNADTGLQLVPEPISLGEPRIESRILRHVVDNACERKDLGRARVHGDRKNFTFCKLGRWEERGQILLKVSAWGHRNGRAVEGSP